MMTVLDFGDTVNGSELLHHLGCLKYKNPVNNGINYQPQPVRRISAINNSYSWITRNRCFLRFGQFGWIWTLGEVHQSSPPHSSIDRRWWRRAFSVWWWRWASHSDSLRKRTDICRVFGPKTVYIVSITCRFFKKNPKFIEFPAKTQSGLIFFYFYFCFFFFLFNHISYIYIGLEPETKSCVQFLLIPLLTVLKESPWWNHLSLRFPGGSSQGGGNVTSESQPCVWIFLRCTNLKLTYIAMENPPFWWYSPGKMGIFMGYVSFREGTPPGKLTFMLHFSASQEGFPS